MLCLYALQFQSIISMYRQKVGPIKCLLGNMIGLMVDDYNRTLSAGSYFTHWESMCLFVDAGGKFIAIQQFIKIVLFLVHFDNDYDGNASFYYTNHYLS